MNTIKQAMAQAAIRAREDGKTYYVYPRGDTGTSFAVRTGADDGWLFRAYPGGRKELSVAGKRIVEKQEPKTESEIDSTLRSAGMNPDDVARRMKQFVDSLIYRHRQSS